MEKEIKGTVNSLENLEKVLYVLTCNMSELPNFETSVNPEHRVLIKEFNQKIHEDNDKIVSWDDNNVLIHYYGKYAPSSFIKQTFELIEKILKN